ncbi:hypothetical protein BHE74_00059761 [Ensete ventricosum]|nr:hypothetical protein BHE74_00059761 [Ensete ventricosum]
MAEAIHGTCSLSFHRPKGNCSENTGVLKQAIEKDEEEMTSPEELSYPKAKCRLKIRWTRRSVIVPDGTSVELSIPCSHGGTTLVVKGVEEVKNTEINSKYQDMAEGQRQETL